MSKIVNIKTKQGCFCKACTNTTTVKVWHILLIGFILGIIVGYVWHYQSTRNWHEFCTWQDIPEQEIVLNNKIPAKIIQP